MMTATMGFRRRQSSRMPASCAASRLHGMLRRWGRGDGDRRLANHQVYCG
jgi:hypothetical protein